MSRNPGPTIFDRLVSLRLPAELEDRLRELAADTGLSQSELHRRALHTFLDGVAGFGLAADEAPAENVVQSEKSTL